MEQRNCIYCGKPVQATKYTLRAGKTGSEELYCCGIECYQNMKRYIESTSGKNNALYVIAALLVVANLFIFGYKLNFRWMYVPMMGLGVIVMLRPSLYVTNYMFERFGVVKTVKIVRIVGAVIVLLGMLFTILWKA